MHSGLTLWETLPGTENETTGREMAMAMRPCISPSQCPYPQPHHLLTSQKPCASSSHTIDSTSRKILCSEFAPARLGAASWNTKTLKAWRGNGGNCWHAMQPRASVFQPALGRPFSGPSDDVQLLEKQQERGGLPDNEMDTVYNEPSSSTETRIFRRWVVQPEEEGNFYLPMLIAAQSTPPSRQKQESSEHDNFYVNCGSAIRALREELPALFYKDLNYDIYREDITFRDPMNTFCGKDNYKLIFWALRFHGRIFFKALWVDIVRVWQPTDKVIMVRWTVRGIPRVPWEAQGHFDGTSEYKLDKDGKIYEHKVDNVIMNSPPKFQRSVMDLVRVAAGQTTPTPSFYETAGEFFSSTSPYLLQFTWVRFYWALRSTLALTSTGEQCNKFVPSPNFNP